MVKKEKEVKVVKEVIVELPKVKRARGEGYTTDSKSLSRRYKS